MPAYSFCLQPVIISSNQRSFSTQLFVRRPVFLGREYFLEPDVMDRVVHKDVCVLADACWFCAFNALWDIRLVVVALTSVTNADRVVSQWTRLRLGRQSLQ